MLSSAECAIASPQYAYVANSGSASVSAIDWKTNSVIATIPVGQDPVGLAVTPNGAFVYVANYNSQNMSVIATASNTVISTIPFDAQPSNLVISPDGKYAYVDFGTSHPITVVATATNTVVGNLLASGGFGAAAITPDGRFLYVLASGNTVAVVSVALKAVVANIPVAGANAIAMTPDGKFAYVTGNGSVSVIATASKSVVATIADPEAADYIAINPDGSLVYAAPSVISTTTNSVVGAIPVESGENHVAISPDGVFVYVANYDSNTISVISSATNTLVDTIPVGAYPRALAFVPTQEPPPPTVLSFNVIFGSQYYNLMDSKRDRLPWRITGIQAVFSERIDSGDASSLTGAQVTGFSGLGTDKLTWNIRPISDGNNTITLAAAGAHGLRDERGAVLNGGSNYIRSFKTLLADFNDDGVVNGSDVAGIIKAHSQPYDIFADTNGDGIAGDVPDVLLSTASIGTSNPSGDGFPPYIYVVNQGSDNVSVIDRTTNTVVATIPVGASPAAVAVAPNDEFVYVVNAASGFISVIPTASNTLLTTIPIQSPGGIAWTPDSKFVYASDGNSVSVISTVTNTAVTSIPVLPCCEPLATGSVAISPNGQLAYVSLVPESDSLDGSVSVISTVNNAVLASVDLVGRDPGMTAFTPDGKFAYVPVANQYGHPPAAFQGEVNVVSTATNEVVATIPVGVNPGSVAITPNGQFAYVTNAGFPGDPPYFYPEAPASVSVISTATREVVTTISVGGASGVAISPDGVFAYVTNSANNTVLVIATATNQIVKTIPVGIEPGPISVVPGRP